MIVNIRTRDDLHTLLSAGQSGNWNIHPKHEPKITKVRIFSWDGTSVLLGDYNDPSSSRVPSDRDRLLVGFINAKIDSCNINWYNLYRQAPVVYGTPIDIQDKRKTRIGIVRESIKLRLKGDINDFFNRLIKEIKLTGINKIVFKSGGIPLPQDFIDWCKENNVEIEILDETEINTRYPIENNIPFDEILSTKYNNEKQ